MRSGAATPATRRRFWTRAGPLVGAARPEELAEAAEPDVALPVLLAVPEEAEAEDDEEVVVLRFCWSVMVAVKPVALVQLELTVELIPETKLTAAH